MMFSESEKNLINEIMNQEDSEIDWADPRLRTLKKKIKERLLLLQGEQCCYCLCDTHESGSGALDIEHVLPKGYPVNETPKPFLGLMLENENLAIACKRCNASIKRARVDFLVNLDIDTDSDNWKDLSLYRIIHPRIEEISNFLKRHKIHLPEVLLLKFSLKSESEKARFHYEYFELSTIEVLSIDGGQGIESLDPDLQAVVQRLNNLQTF